MIEHKLHPPERKAEAPSGLADVPNKLQAAGLRSMSMATRPAQLAGVLVKVQGQPFLAFEFTYGDELTLHLGQRISYVSAKLKGLYRGSYIVGTRASDWFLFSSVKNAILYGSEGYLPRMPFFLVGNQTSTFLSQVEDAINKDPAVAKEELETGSFIQPGTRVLSVDAFHAQGRRGSAYGLSLLLSDNSWLRILPDSARRRSAKGQEIADWEVFLPNGEHLSAGPGEEWSHSPPKRKAVLKNLTQVFGVKYSHSPTKRKSSAAIQTR